MKPLAVTVEEFRRLVGGIGKTTAFAIIKAGGVDRAKIGRRTVITLESIESFMARSIDGSKS